MKDDVYLELEILIGLSEVDIEKLKNLKKIDFSDFDLFITVNRTPSFRGRIIKKDSISIVKIIKILSEREMEKIKEKYL